ncbi:hypothetical protein CR513_50679, partial [Mucuna pruriens]
MARGSNDKHSRTDNTSQHDNHIVNISTAASATPENPRGTANLVVHCSGVVQSFNNCDNGSQDFRVTTINTSGIGNSFNNLRSGLQAFKDAQICCVDNSAKHSTSILPWKRDRPVHSGILHSFNNGGSGSQTFDGIGLHMDSVSTYLYANFYYNIV